ncbi:MAG: hypothetical protein ACRDLP_02890 [Solirubrobacteraceae bacterium]
MTFAIVYIENGDFVADFDSQDEAVVALREFVGEHPSLAERVGLLTFDDSGNAVGDLRPAGLMAAAQPA